MIFRIVNLLVYINWILLFSLSVFLFPVQAAIDIYDLRLGVHGEQTRFVMELSKSIKYDILLLNNPYRLVIDLEAAEWKKKKKSGGGIVSNIRFGTFEPKQSRIVLDMKQPFVVEKHFILPPSINSKHHRLVMDIKPTKAVNFKSKTRFVKNTVQKKKLKVVVIDDIRPLLGNLRFTPLPRLRNNKPVIVIDPGHGGVDPGAHGRVVQEKDAVLKFAHDLAKQLAKTRRYQVYLTRYKDVFIPLRERVQFAQNKKADLFISIHADASKKKYVKGMSVYTLSNHASDKEAAALARKENKSDIMAGLDFSDLPIEATNILINLAQRDSKNRSIQLSEILIENMRKMTNLLERPHRFAGFRVLKAPNIPSILVELGFLTNRQDEKKIQSKQWRTKIAYKFVQVIEQFFNTRKNYMFN